MANVVTGIFAYPVFGALAGIGILVKLTGISGVKEHNKIQKLKIDLIQVGVKSGCSTYHADMNQSVGKMRVIKEFTVTKEKIDEDYITINKEIDSQFKKICIVANGSVSDNGGEIKVQFKERI